METEPKEENYFQTGDYRYLSFFYIIGPSSGQKRGFTGDVYMALNWTRDCARVDKCQTVRAPMTTGGSSRVSKD